MKVNRRRSLASRFGSAAVAVALTLSVAACGSDDSGSNKADKLRIVQAAEPQRLDPMLNSNSWAGSSWTMNALYGTMFVLDTESGELRPGLATPEVVDGGKTIVVTVDPALKFSDDTPVDAETIKWNLERGGAEGAPAETTAVMDQVESIEVTSPTELRITLKKPNAVLPSEIASSRLNWLTSKAAIEKGPEAFDKAPVGAGPYVLKSWQRQGKTVLTKNPDYVNADDINFETVEITSVTDQNQRMNLLTSGQADLVADYSTLAAKTAKDAGMKVFQVTLPGAQGFTLNTRHAPFDDVRARRAVSGAIDSAAINEAVYENTADMVDTFLDESHPMYADVPWYKYDPETSQKLFDELAAEGKPVKFTITGSQLPDTKRTMEIIQAQLSKFDNVTVKLEVLDYASALAKTMAREFDATTGGVYGGDPVVALSDFFSSTSGKNGSGLSLPELDSLLAEARAATDPEERKELAAQVQEIVADQAPYIWWNRPAPMALAGKNVSGVTFTAPGGVVLDGIKLD